MVFARLAPMRVFHLVLFAFLGFAWSHAIFSRWIEADLEAHSSAPEFSLEAGVGPLADGLQQPPAVDLIASGKAEAEKQTICLGGLVHNGQFSFQRAMWHTMKTVNMFADWRIVLLESDSTDQTKEIMRAYRLDLSPEDQQRVILSMHDFGEPVIGHDPLAAVRFRGLARLRNRLLREMRSVCNAAIPGATYAFADMDISRGWEADGVASSFRPDIAPWGAMCANGIVNDGSMWDALAFRSDAIPDTRRGKRFLVFHQMSAALQQYFAGPDPVPVRSCFGGLALYAHEAAQACDYDEATVDCEHVSFNQCVAKFGSVAINPYMVLYYGTSTSEIWISKTYAFRAYTWILARTALAISLFAVLAIRDRDPRPAAPRRHDSL